jgi:hypothetical protein
VVRRRVLKRIKDQRKQTKLQWFQDPREINGDNLNNARNKVSRYFKGKEGIYERRNE